MTILSVLPSPSCHKPSRCMWRRRIFLKYGVCACMLGHSVMSESLWLHGLCLPDSSVHGIFQARILEWVAIYSFRGSSWPRDQTGICLLHCRQILYQLNHLGSPSEVLGMANYMNTYLLSLSQSQSSSFSVRDLKSNWLVLSRGRKILHIHIIRGKDSSELQTYKHTDRHRELIVFILKFQS